MMDAPILQYRFSHINNKQVTDYASGNNGTINGGCTIVTDPTMGNCIDFDGSTGYISVGDLNFDFSNGLTVTAWVNYEAFNQYARIIDFGNGCASSNIVLYNDQTQSNPRFANYITSTESRLNCTEDLHANEWQHVAVTVTPAGQTILYIDGVQAATDTNSGFLPSNIVRKSNYIGKSNWPADGMFQGKMAWLSMYNSPLSPADIIQEMNNALLERGAYRASFPVGFKLQSNNQGAESPVIYLENSGAGETLSLTIENSSNSTLTLSPATSTAPSQTNYHFLLKFRPGVLSPTVLKKGQLQLSSPGGGSVSAWQITQGQSSDGCVYISLLATGNTLPQIQTYQNFQLDFNGVVADPSGGSRTTNVEFFYQNVGYSSTGASLQGSRLQHLDIISHIGQKNIPLKADIVGSPTILNDGASANEVLIRITNTSESDISLISGNPASTFTVSLPGQATGTLADWALAEMDNLKQVQLQWGVLAVADNTSNQTSIRLQKPLVQALDSGAAITITPPSGNPVQTTLNSAAVEGAQTINVSSKESVVAGSIITQTVNNGSGWLPPAQSAPSNSVTFSIVNASQTKLAGGECLVIVLSNIVTGVKTGTSAITLGYTNIPGYWDGQLVVELLKSPLVCDQQSVGIGTNAPAATLDVNGTITATNVGIGIDKPICPLQVDGAIIATNLGLGTNMPTATLGVGGTISATGTISGVGLPPTNSIMMLSGSLGDNFDSTGLGVAGTQYEGWAICNGKNGTPNLEDRFIMGVSNNHAVNTSGGPDYHTHTVDVPSQTISTTNDGAHSHNLPSSWCNRSLSCGDHCGMDVAGTSAPWSTESVSDHCHSVTVSYDAITSSTYSGPNRPAYYALYFIMRMA